MDSEITNNDIVLQRIRSVIERVLHNGKVVARSDNSVNDISPVAINAVQGEALRNWVIKEKAIQTIEIGLAWGLGALHICEGLLTNGDQNAHHITIDPFQHHFKDCGLQLLEEAGVLNFIEHTKTESQIALPKFVSEGRQFDLAFVDGSHLFDRVFLDLIYLGRLVRPRGVIFADDYQAPAVAKAVSFCLSNLGWKIEEMAPSDERHQWVVLRTVHEPIPRSYPHFIDF
ncbi:MAG: class I SAM-dependent methyltransferase [Candidatus Sungbacteria bacterium]|nr:class I SAM-dependent methyltransferase [Candidatus Sungbacteria bacterium]